MKWSLKLSTNLEKKSAPNAVEVGGVSTVGGREAPNAAEGGGVANVGG